MLHIFIASADAEVRPGATGKEVTGYQARIVDDKGQSCHQYSWAAGGEGSNRVSLSG